VKFGLKINERSKNTASFVECFLEICFEIRAFMGIFILVNLAKLTCDNEFVRSTSTECRITGSLYFLRVVLFFGTLVKANQTKNNMVIFTSISKIIRAVWRTNCLGIIK